MLTNWNTQPYNSSNTNYNMMEALYIDGSNCISISGPTYYSNTFGNIQASLVLDKGDFLAGGNVIIAGDTYIVGNLQTGSAIISPTITSINGNITTANSNISTLQSSMTTANSNISTLQSSMTTANSNISTLQGQVNGGTISSTVINSVTTNFNGNLTVSQNESITGNLTVSGNSTILQNESITGNLTVTGSITSPTITTMNNNLTNLNSQVFSGTISPAYITSTSVVFSGNITAQNLNINGNLSVTYDVNCRSLTATGNASINGNVSIGGFNNQNIGGNNIQFGDINSLSKTGSTIGVDNTCIGKDTMSNKSVTGNLNTGVGRYCLNNLTTGSRNTAIGQSALMSSIINSINGNCNTACGVNSLLNIYTGNYNSAFGCDSGYGLLSAVNITGNYNTFLGAETQPYDPTFSNTTALGYGAISYQNYQMVLGLPSNFVYIAGTQTASTTSYNNPLNLTASLGALVVEGGIYGGDNMFIKNKITTGNILTGNLTTTNSTILQNETISGNLTVSGNIQATSGNTSTSYLTVGGDLQVNGFIKTNQINTFTNTPPSINFNAITLTPTLLATGSGQLIATVTVYPFQNNNISFIMPTFTSVACTAVGNKTTVYTCVLSNQTFNITILKNGNGWLNTNNVKLFPTNTVKFQQVNSSAISANVGFGFSTGSTTAINFTPDFINNENTNDVYTVYIGTSSILSTVVTFTNTGSAISLSSIKINQTSAQASTIPANGSITSGVGTYTAAYSTTKSAIIAGIKGGLAVNDMCVGGNLIISGTGLIPSGGGVSTSSGGGITGSTQRAIIIDPSSGTITFTQNNNDNLNIPTNSSYGIDMSTNNCDISGQLQVFSNSILYGDASLNGNLFVGLDTSLNGNLTVSNNLNCNNIFINGYIQSPILINDPTAATNYGEGSLVNVGGLGVGGNCYVNGLLGTNSNVLTGLVQPTNVLAIGYQNYTYTSTVGTLVSNTWFYSGLSFSVTSANYGTYLIEFTAGITTSNTATFIHGVSLSTSSTTPTPPFNTAYNNSYFMRQYLPGGSLQLLRVTRTCSLYTTQTIYGMVFAIYGTGTGTMNNASLNVTRIA